MKEPIRCIICGCHQDMACVGGCSWVSMDPPLCSSCNNPDDLRNVERPEENLLATPEPTKYMVRSYFKAVEIHVSVTSPGNRKDVWFVELLSLQNEKLERFGKLVKALFDEPVAINRVKYQVKPEKYALAIVKDLIRKSAAPNSVYLPTDIPEERPLL